MQLTDRRIIVLGAGGHARVLIDALLLRGCEILGVTAPAGSAGVSGLLGVPLIGRDDQIAQYRPCDVLLANGVGSVGDARLRRRLFETWRARGYRFASIVHPAAVIARGVELAEGAQVMAGAVVQTGCCLGTNTIVNTTASIDHDCRLADHCHIAPGATLSGNVDVGEAAHLGTGAVVVQGVQIGAGALVAAGAVVTRDVAAGQRVQGVPARLFQEPRMMRDCA